jgi:hypothetical protein
MAKCNPPYPAAQGEKFRSGDRIPNLPTVVTAGYYHVALTHAPERNRISFAAAKRSDFGA